MFDQQTEAAMAKSPFPGMDPYLEAPEIWHSLHTRLINIFADLLTPLLAPKYIADLQTEVVIEQLDPTSNGESGGGTGIKIPDVLVMARQEPALLPPAAPSVATAEAVAVAPLRLQLPHMVERRLTTIRILQQPKQKLVTVVELLSPVNKRPGDKRQEYLAKRQRYLESHVHLVEIDLLRRWPRMPLAEEPPPCDYLILVSNAYEWPVASVWALTVRNPLPIIEIPLLRGDPPVDLDLGDALRTAYARARYDLRIDYQQPPKPPLSAEDGEWARAVVAVHTQQA
jgi:hypothetical protein